MVVGDTARSPALLSIDVERRVCASIVAGRAAVRNMCRTPLSDALAPVTLLRHNTTTPRVSVASACATHCALTAQHKSAGKSG
jgi:hypothetical protein